MLIRFIASIYGGCLQSMVSQQPKSVQSIKEERWEISDRSHEARSYWDNASSVLALVHKADKIWYQTRRPRDENVPKSERTRHRSHIHWVIRDGLGSSQISDYLSASVIGNQWGYWFCFFFCLFVFLVAPINIYKGNNDTQIGQAFVAMVDSKNKEIQKVLLVLSKPWLPGI